MPCSYCDRPGCNYDECPERLEDKFGTSSGYDPENLGELKIADEGDEDDD